jgi:hypothetical protein
LAAARDVTGKTALAQLVCQLQEFSRTMLELDT